MRGRIVTAPPSLIGRRETSEYSERSKPWAVVFTYLHSPYTMQYVERLYYVRAADPGSATWAACRYWMMYEKPSLGKGTYPAIAGAATAHCIDEQDYRKALKDSRRWPHHYMGDAENPGLFTFLTDEAMKVLYLGTEFFTLPGPKREVDVI